MKEFDQLIIGENLAYSTDCTASGLNNNVLVVGGSGTGKTMSLLEPCLLETQNDSLIVSLSKKKLIPKYSDMFRERGYAVKVIDFRNPAASTDFYNPLLYIRSFTDIKYLADSIIAMQDKSANSTADPYWDLVSSSLISAEVAYCLARCKNPTFADVLKLHDELEIFEEDLMIRTSLDERFNALPADHFARKCFRSFRELPMRTAGSAFSSLNVLLDKLFTPELRVAMGAQESVDVTDLAQKKTVLFVVSDPTSCSMTAFVNMFIGQAVKELFDFAEEQPSGELPIAVRLLCDDFACQRISRFDQLISIFREKRLSCMLLIQSESQLAGLYGESGATTIINNCDTYVYGGGQDLMSARHISVRADVPLPDVLYMPIGSLWVFRRGQKPLRTKRYPITEDERYKVVTSRYEAAVAEKSDREHGRVRPRMDFYLGSERKSDRRRGRELTEREVSEKTFDELFGWTG